MELLRPVSAYSVGMLRQIKYMRPVIHRLTYSTKTQQADEIVTMEKISLTKPSVTKWKRPPFLKGFFLGKFDTELMAFPEVLDEEQVVELESQVKIIHEVMSSQAKCPGKSDYLQELKNKGLFGRMIPEKYGGLELTQTACTRLNEVLGLDWSLCCSLAAHEFVTQTLLNFGSESQKQYLPQLASGESLGAYCCSELDSGSELWSMKTVATLNDDGNYIINGVKSWVTNAERAGVFLVFAKTEQPMEPGSLTISVFLIDKDTKGVSVRPLNSRYLHGTCSGTVHFDDVIVTKSHLVGEVGQGFDIYFKSLETLRTSSSTFTFGSLKSLLDRVTEKLINTERVEKYLSDHQLVRTRLSRINSMIYGMESLSYFHAALIDSTENPDISLECAALKLFNSNGTLFCIQELTEALGSQSFLNEAQMEAFHRDAVAMRTFECPNDVTRLQLSLLGLKHAGVGKAEFVQKIRNRFFFPQHSMKNEFRHYLMKYNLRKYEHDISGHLHPSLLEWGNELEKSLQKFELAVESVFEEHGAKVTETQLSIRMLADIVADFYAMSAVLSRVSRSYCIGLKNSHHELRLAHNFCFDANRRIKQNFTDIMIGVHSNNEKAHLILGEQVVDCRGYFPEHPLKHNG